MPVHERGKEVAARSFGAYQESEIIHQRITLPASYPAEGNVLRGSAVSTNQDGRPLCLVFGSIEIVKQIDNVRVKASACGQSIVRIADETRENSDRCQETGRPDASD